MLKKNMVWMLVTNDVYELPLVCENSAKALAEACRMTKPEFLKMRRQAELSVKVKKVKVGRGAVHDRK